MFYYFTVYIFCFPNEGFKHVGNRPAVQGLAAAFKRWALCLYELPRGDAGAQAPVCIQLLPNLAYFFFIREME